MKKCAIRTGLRWMRYWGDKDGPRWTIVIAAVLVAGFCCGYSIGHGEIMGPTADVDGPGLGADHLARPAAIFIPYGVTALGFTCRSGLNPAGCDRRRRRDVPRVARCRRDHRGEHVAQQVLAMVERKRNSLVQPRSGDASHA